MSDENGAECGLGEGTHYGCECVMRRLADAERERDEALASASRLREALGPFAAAGEHALDDRQPNCVMGPVVIRGRDFVRAARALSSPSAADPAHNATKEG